MSNEALAELEQRVIEKLRAATPGGEMSEPAQFPVPGNLPPLPDDVPQFPRPRYVYSSARRAHALCLADVLIDQGKLSDAAMLIEIGGRERIA